MLSISDNEFAVISFLIRDFSKPYTMRSIAIELKQSPAGVFSILKKLEKKGIVTSDKLGTGLFYRLELENRIAAHLAAVSLLMGDSKKPDISRLRAQAAVYDGKNLLVITESLAKEELKLKDVNVIAMTRFEAEDGLRKKDKELLAVIKNGQALAGEILIVEIIKNGMPRY